MFRNIHMENAVQCLLTLFFIVVGHFSQNNSLYIEKRDIMVIICLKNHMEN